MQTALRARRTIIFSACALVGMLVLALYDLVMEYAIADFFLVGALLFFMYLLRQLWHQNQSTITTANKIESTERRNALLAAAIESTPAGVVIADATQDGHPIIFVNKSFTAITGYSAEEAIGQSCGFLQGIHTDKEAKETIRTALQNKQPVHLTILNYRKDQTPFWNDLQITPLFDDAGDIRNFIALQNDVTNIHDTQEALKIAKEQAERATNVKSNFLAMMSHEIRTPINGILGTLALLNEMPLNTEAKQLAETAYESGEGLLTIVNDMLDFSKIEAGKLAIENITFDLHELIESCMTLMQTTANKRGISFTLSLDPTAPKRVASDPTRIKQVLLNLISNAIKFTEQGGVTVKVSNLMANASEHGTECIVRFEVTDTGIGMSHEGMTRVFTEFNQLDPSIARRYGGTGLGLAICKNLITMMNGEINVESRLGEGSKFSFVIPLSVITAQADALPPPETTQQAVAHNAHILVVEDNETNQLVLTKMLERDGHRYDIAENGAVALEKLKKIRYDLVFMDVSMPVMDGLTATRHIRDMGDNFTRLPIIAMTAQTMPGDRERCLAAGMSDYLSKPVNRDALIRMTQHWLTQEEREVLKHEPSKPTETADVLNWQILRQMEEDVGSDTVGRLLNVFENDLARRSKIFQAALAAKDCETLLRESHTLKSSSASCGLSAFSAHMQKIEVALTAGDEATALSEAMEVDQMAHAAQTALKHARAFYQGEHNA